MPHSATLLKLWAMKSVELGSLLKLWAMESVVELVLNFSGRTIKYYNFYKMFSYKELVFI